MIKTLSVAVQFLESKGFHCQLSEKNERVVRLNFRADNVESVEVLLVFDEDEHSVSCKCYNLCKFPENKKLDMYRICNELNANYRWLKFYVDESDNTITAQIDAVIQLESCGAECYELVGRSVAIADEAYPKFMKAIWQ